MLSKAMERKYGGQKKKIVSELRDIRSKNEPQ
jgi:hypothetical protein